MMEIIVGISVILFGFIIGGAGIMVAKMATLYYGEDFFDNLMMVIWFAMALLFAILSLYIIFLGFNLAIE